VTATRWIDVDGAVNMRDLGGLPTEDGGAVRARRLIRSDNLQDLTAGDVHVLLEQHRVRGIADLRTGVEVTAEGPGPLTHEPLVAIGHFSLFPEAGRNTDVAAVDDDAPIVLPWQERRADPEAAERRGAAGVYLGYLQDRADSVLAALRFIAAGGAASAAAEHGAVIVHCAAGKDRTGVVTALALSEVGVQRDAIIADYARSAERIEAIFARLRASRTYADDLAEESIDHHRPRAETMQRFLTGLDDEHGGAAKWLRGNGWTDADAEALRAHLLG
jgi:protein tyrosine/serine phosphatase